MNKESVRSVIEALVRTGWVLRRDVEAATNDAHARLAAEIVGTNRAKSFLVDIPNPANAEGAWECVGEFDSRAAAVAWIKENLGGDDDGKIDLITELDLEEVDVDLSEIDGAAIAEYKAADAAEDNSAD